MPASAGIRYVRAPMLAPLRHLPLALLVLAACSTNSASMPAVANAAEEASDAYRVLAENWAFAGAKVRFAGIDRKLPKAQFAEPESPQ